MHERLCGRIFDTTYSVHLPAYYTEWMSVFRFLSFRWTVIIGVPGPCLARSFGDELLLTALMPLLLIAVALVVLTLYSCRSSGVREALQSGLLSATPFALLAAAASFFAIAT